MKSTIKYLAFAVGCTLMMASCSDSWLETEPTSSVSGDELSLLLTMQNKRLMAFAVLW